MCVSRAYVVVVVVGGGTVHRCDVLLCVSPQWAIGILCPKNHQKKKKKKKKKKNHVFWLFFLAKELKGVLRDVCGARAVVEVPCAAAPWTG